MKVEWASHALIMELKDKIIFYHTNNNTKAKRDLVFLHGYSDNGKCWDRVAGEFVDDYNVILLDAPGHGESSEPKIQKIKKRDPDYSKNPLIEDVYDAITELELKNVVLIGHSMGAGQAALFASIYPGLIKGIFLEDPPLVASKFNRLLKFIGPLAYFYYRWFDKPKSLEYYDAHVREINPTWEDIDIEPWCPAQQRWRSHDQYACLKMLTQFPGYKGIIKNIQCPSYLLTSGGGITTPERAKEVEKMNSNVDWKFIENANHNIRREAYEEYLSLLKKFLGKL